MSTTRRVGLLVNPLAGRGQAGVVGREAALRLRGMGHDVAVFDSTSLTASIDAVEAALDSGGVDVVVVVGGDGAVNLAVNLLASHDIALGVVPAGTGNDTARSWRMPMDPVAALDTIDACLRSGTSRTVDTVAIMRHGLDGPGRVDLSLTRDRFAGVMATGFDAAVSERANRWSWPRGPARYNLAIARELPFYRARSYRLDLDGDTWDVDGLLVCLASTASYGGGMQIAPTASVVDGLIDIVVVHPVSTLRFVRMFPKVYKGTHVDLPDVEVRQAKRVTVTTTDSRPPVVAYADGERIGPLPIVAEVLPGALRLLARSVG